ncbi:MAG TPA: DUF1345 domain-containing protein [Paraburkholderia sp.]|nr:DUF1345 domain-containing protein [Paraburkholderia sp.]
MNFYPQTLRYRPQLVTAIVVGAVAGFLVPPTIKAVTRMLIGWNFAVWTYLALMWIHMAISTDDSVSRNARREDENAGTVLFLICTATVASLVAIVLELGTTKSLGLGSKLAHTLLTATTLIGAWFLIPTIFTLHYARLYYGSEPDAPALVFPENESTSANCPKLNPNYWDFLYFSFTIAVASQTADIGLRGRHARRSVLAQSVLSFYFNVAVLGLCVNIAASMVGG